MQVAEHSKDTRLRQIQREAERYTWNTSRIYVYQLDGLGQLEIKCLAQWHNAPPNNLTQTFTIVSRGP